MVRIENWIVTLDNRLEGYVYGHPRIQDGHRASTSLIQGKRNGYVVTLSGTEYELGIPDGDFNAGVVLRYLEEI